ncbi:MAG: DsrE family protein [Flavobacteriales bacterium]|nr:DsrE family protein [Flavobacteriales bacterium]MBK7270823.1 DsrE family protein [Flavobacteriales bacterium]MBK7751764.1 DsrE family protein [Flavobacteriales bacterium]MBK9076501.1 DsrE family protein [Flavobacteriales bacterium]
MKKLLFLFILLFAVTGAFPQNAPRHHRIIMQLTSGDTLVHKNLMKQFRNMKEAAPTMQLEVVCHGPGMDMLMSDRSIVQEKVKEFAAKGIVFLACENTIKERSLDRTKVVPDAGYVKAGIIHIVERQEDGWSYIKAGF